MVDFPTINKGLHATLVKLSSSRTVQPNLVRSEQPASKVISTFWNAQGIVLLNFLEPGAIFNSEHYIKTLIKLKARIACIRPKKTFFLQHDNARPLVSLKTTECVTKLAGQGCLIHHIALTLHHQIFICLGL